MLGEGLTDGLSVNKGRVSVENDNIAAVLFDKIPRLHNGVTRAEPLGLERSLTGCAQMLLKKLGAETLDNADIFNAAVAHGLYHPVYHR